MYDTKGLLNSRTVAAGLAMLVYTILNATGVLPSEVTQPMVETAIYSVGSLAVVWYRAKATKKVG